MLNTIAHFLILLFSVRIASAYSAACDPDNDFEIVGYSDLPGNDLSTFTEVTFQECRKKCREDRSCQFFYYHYNQKQCWTKAFKVLKYGTIGVLTSGSGIKLFSKADVEGWDIESHSNVDHVTCQNKCEVHNHCMLYQWDGNNCFLKKFRYAGEGVLGIKAARKVQVECEEKIRGVNLGGWLILEKWMLLSSKNGPFRGTAAIDEWTLCQQLGKRQCLDRLEQHWSSFITNADIDEIIERGLNAVRIPIGYWSLIPVKSSEPFVAGAWKYLENITLYAGSKNVKVWIDLHGLPGSQNGWDHSGHIIPTGGTWDSSQENLDRSVDAAQEIANRVAASAELKKFVSGIQLINEPNGQNFDKLKKYYDRAYTAIRSKLPNVPAILHDQFEGADQWSLREFWQRPKYSTEIIDGHIYFAFDTPGMTRNELANYTCTSKANDVLKGSRVLPFVVGEWSLGFDCGTCKRRNPKCECDAPGQREWDQKWSELLMDVFEQGYGWFYWNWKTEDPNVWNYQWSARNGYLPANAANRANTCASIGIPFKTVHEQL